MNEHIISFLKKQTNITLATCISNAPYCANCFYAFDEINNALVFKSKSETNHIIQAMQNPKVAGTILPDKLVKAKIQGIQFNGIFSEMNQASLPHSESVYYKRFPFARVFDGELWSIELTEIKMTDNTLGFGKKLEWKREIQMIES